MSFVPRGLVLLADVWKDLLRVTKPGMKPTRLLGLSMLEYLELTLPSKGRVTFRRS